MPPRFFQENVCVFSKPAQSTGATVTSCWNRCSHQLVESKAQGRPLRPKTIRPPVPATQSLANRMRKPNLLGTASNLQAMASNLLYSKSFPIRICVGLPPSAETVTCCPRTLDFQLLGTCCCSSVGALRLIFCHHPSDLATRTTTTRLGHPTRTAGCNP